jgi:hypothetical protein
MNNATETTNSAEEDEETTVQTGPEKPQKKNYGIAIAIGLLMIWVIVRPGVFTIRPNGTLPEGMTIVYTTRSAGIPFFSSPEGLCLAIEGDVTSTCRETALAAAKDLDDRTLLRLPYSHWAYLQSTGGLEFDR